ncbi:MAG: hypothetical protein A3E78_11130 [Alphaproteobacteria bacterium RIFCSPHIGHO2_12_FULL_63_12]|nr:MAG: hypothetical protein A3E78_11130 [Alphaproteobacteria bacterium RIFCSPHIGHO2_12_FULL_63_12]
MAQTRRAILKTGAAGVVILGSGAAAWSLTRAPVEAREPWSKAGTSFGDARLDALSYAILAPNPHNMQPWRIRLDDDALTVFCDLARLLPQTDPPNRQITIGFGCFLELLRQAAANKGIRTETTAFPEGEPQPILDGRPIAVVRFVKDAEASPDPLFAATIARRTNRRPFSERAVGPSALDRIIGASVNGVVAAGTTDNGRVAELRQMAKDAWEIEWALDRTRRESINVTRIGKREIEAKPFGLSLDGPMIEAIAAAGMMTPENMDIPEKAAYEQSIAFYNRAVETASAFLWTSTAENRRTDQLAAGAAWVRMQQAATLEGLAFHPLSQALQEFPEMAPAYDRAHELLAHQQGATVQMLARLGYADAPPPAPREALISKIDAA